MLVPVFAPQMGPQSAVCWPTGATSRPEQICWDGRPWETVSAFPLPKRVRARARWVS